MYHEQSLGIRHRNPELEKQINMASSSKPGSKIGRPRIEQESLRTGNDFRSDLLKNSRYSDCFCVLTTIQYNTIQYNTLLTLLKGAFQ